MEHADAPHDRLSTLFLLVVLLLLLSVACGESPADAYRRGFRAGHDAAEANAERAREEGRRDGFKEGYEVALPPSGVNPPVGKWRESSTIAIIFGLGKVVLSFTIFTFFLIAKSVSWPERAAKIMATSLAMVVVFWLSSTLTIGFSRPLTNVMLARGATTVQGKVLAGFLAALLMWAMLWLLEMLFRTSRGHAYLQTLYVLVSTGAATALVPLFLGLQRAPNLFGYRIFEVSIGIVVGGLAWITHRLLVEAEAHRIRQQRRDARRLKRESTLFAFARRPRRKCRRAG